MQKQTPARASTRRPSTGRSSSSASGGASTRPAPRGSSPAPHHAEIWTMGDLMDYARGLGYTIELTRLTDAERK